MNAREKIIAGRCKKIWEGYKKYASGCCTARRGFEVAGQTASTTDTPCDMERFFSRGESILEHQAKVAWLCSAFANHFLLFPSDCKHLMTVALIHDVGESAIGDIPDDGRAEHNTKDALEYVELEEFTEAYGENAQKEILELFKSFQDKKTLYGQVIYALDKTEFVLMALFLESFGNYGLLSLKEQVTDRDRYFMEMTGTDVAADCWAAHLKTILNKLESDISEPVLALVDVAVRDVRGKPFAWWNKNILPYVAK